MKLLPLLDWLFLFLVTLGIVALIVVVTLLTDLFGKRLDANASRRSWGVVSGVLTSQTESNPTSVDGPGYCRWLELCSPAERGAFGYSSWRWAHLLQTK